MTEKSMATAAMDPINVAIETRFRFMKFFLAHEVRSWHSRSSWLASGRSRPYHQQASYQSRPSKSIGIEMLNSGTLLDRPASRLPAHVPQANRIHLVKECDTRLRIVYRGSVIFG
jgi:hypothetical protein